jgi:hypothetical protein
VTATGLSESTHLKQDARAFTRLDRHSVATFAVTAQLA